MGINKEFLNKSVDNTTKEISDIEKRIINLMKNSPFITADQIAAEIKTISGDGVRYHIKQLKNKNLIKKESTKLGSWIVIE